MAHRVSLPQRVAALEALSPVNYQDALAVHTPARNTPEEWVRLIFGGTPPALRGFLRGVFKLLRVGQAPPPPAEHPLPGKIIHSGPEEVVLGFDLAIGLTARVIVVNPPGQVVMATLVRYDRARGRAVWTILAPIHRVVARYLLDRAANASVSAAV
jgi:Protein of unknown function (DUF2867)